MLPIEHRLPLRSQTDFFSQAEKQHTRFFTLFYRPTESWSQLSVVVPKKGISAATKRTKLKRQVREILRSAIVGKKGIQLVVVVKAAAETATKATLKTELEKNYDQITQNVPST